MEGKNRFAALLERLMEIAEVKNYTLAQELKYDVSYISKWVSGRMIPAEKSSPKVLSCMAHCIAVTASDEGAATLMSEYNAVDRNELEQAFVWNLQVEYDYVRSLQKATGASIAPSTSYFPELSLPQFINKMRHPVLFRVKSLDVMAAIDIMNMEHEYRLQVADIENGHLQVQRVFPDVHFSMIINLEFGVWNPVYDTVFLINMLTNFAHINFHLYGGIEASGRVLFTVKDDFSISGMLVAHKQCLAVTVSENGEDSNVLYRAVEGMCSREKLLLRETTMEDMLAKFDYVHAVLSTNLRWVLGHLTEHFVPDDLFEELLPVVLGPDMDPARAQELRSTHALTQGILEESPVKLLLYESAFSDLIVSGQLDFFNHKIELTNEQRTRYIENLRTLCETQPNIEIKLIHGRMIADFQYIANPCVFLADVISYLRLDNNSAQNKLLIINRAELQSLFDLYYRDAWSEKYGTVISDRATIVEYIRHTEQSIHLLSRLGGGEKNNL